jgi:CDP-glycerol glycerophosphotransferase (TagB/SpsB family)
MTDNTEAVYEELLRQHWNDKYRLLWVLSEQELCPKIQEKNVLFRRAKSQRASLFLARCKAAAIIDCNSQQKKLTDKTVHLYLSHGSPIKSVKDYYFCDETTDYVLLQSEFFRQVDAREFHVPEEKLVQLGFPRNDVLLSKRVDLRQVFGDYRGFVAWYPTYRQHKSSGVDSTQISIPVLHDLAEAEKINEIAGKYQVLILVKPHPAQDISKIKKLELSHIRFLEDSFFTEHGFSSYEFLAATDAMITDYSSVFFDFLLTDQPIGLTFEDAEDYAKHPGFAIDTALLQGCSEMLDTAQDFERFLSRIASGEDPLREKRAQVKRLTNTYVDGNASKRVVEFLAQEIAKRQNG